MNINKLIDDNKWNDIFELIKKNKLDPNEKVNGNNIFHLACSNNNEVIVYYILKKYKSIIYKSNDDGNTCVHIFSQFGFYKLLKSILIKEPKLIKMINNKHETILHIIKNPEVLEWIYDNIELNEDEQAIILITLINNIKLNDNKFIEKILSNKVNLSLPRSNPPLIYAIKQKKYDIVKLLLHYKADPNIMDNKFMTPIILAVKINEYKIIKLLIKYNAALDYFGPEGDENILMMAIANNNEQIIDLLLQNNISTTIYDRYFDTPAHLCLMKDGFSKNIIFKILLFSDVNAKNIDRITPLYLLIKKYDWRDFTEVLKLKPELDLSELDPSKSIKKLLDDKNQYTEFVELIKPSKIIINNKLSQLITEYNTTNFGRFNSNTVHNLIYTVLILAKYRNLSVPFQYFDENKAKTDRQFITMNIDRTQNGKLTGELIESYYNLFYQLAPYIIIWHSEYSYYIHPDIMFHMKKSLLSKKIRFIFIKLTLVHQEGIHANIIIYDKVLGIMERFDPYGYVPYLNTDLLDKGLKEYFAPKFKQLGLKFKYYSSKKLFKYISFQIVSNDQSTHTKKLGDPIGYCLAWTLWYLEQRINNPDVHPKILIHRLTQDLLHNSKSNTDNSFISYIRNYAATLDNSKNNIMISSGISKNDIYDLVIKEDNLKLLLKYLINYFKTIMGAKLRY